MTQDYTSCPKCGAAMKIYTHYVPLITWNGQPVCGSCETELKNKTEKTNFINGMG